MMLVLSLLLLFAAHPQLGPVSDSFYKPLVPYGHFGFADAKHGWLFGSRTIYKTSDGGASWRPVTICENGALNYPDGSARESFSLVWQDPSRAIVRTVFSIALLSEQGCSILNFPLKNPLVSTDIRFYDERTGWVTAGGDGVYRTSDGGASWSRFAMKNVPYGLVPISASDIWGTRGGELLHSIDGGATWKTVLTEKWPLMSRICMTSGGTGWWLGSGFLYRTTDRGENWQLLSVQTNGDISFSDKDEGWIVGERGIILHSSDGGTTWERQSGGTAAELVQVQALPAGEAWVWGRDGTVLQTIDHGRTWKRIAVE